MQLQPVQGQHVEGFGFVISRWAAMGGGSRMMWSLPSLFKAEGKLDSPGLRGARPAPHTSTLLHVLRLWAPNSCGDWQLSGRLCKGHCSLGCGP